MEALQQAKWKKLLLQGTFDDYFPHRVNACFRYLDAEQDEVFSLKDLIQRGPFVFSCLCIDIEQDSSFAIMDMFRTFDKSGRGNVNIEEFTVGIMDKLLDLKDNTVFLEEICTELLACSAVVSELTNKLEKPQSLDKVPKFKAFMKNCIFLVCHQLKMIQRKVALDSAFRLTPALLLSVLQDSITRTVLDCQSYFSISNRKMNSMLNRSEESWDSSLKNSTGHALLPAATAIVWNIANLRNVWDDQHQTHLGENADNGGGGGGNADTHSPSTRQNRANSIDAFGKGKEDFGAVDVGQNLLGTSGDALNTKIPLDRSQIVLLRNTFQTIESFLGVSNATAAAAAAMVVDDSTTTPFVNGADNMKTEHRQLSTHHHFGNNKAHVENTSSNIDSSKLSNEHLMLKLFETQEALRRTKMRTNLLELVQLQVIENNNNIHQTGNSPVPGEEASICYSQPESGVSVVSSNGNGSVSFDTIMSELGVLRACISERGTEDFPLGHFLQNKMAVVDMDTDYASALNITPKLSGNGDEEENSGGLKNKTLTMLIGDISHASKDIMTIMKNESVRAADYDAALKACKQQEDGLLSMKAKLEQVESERNEFLSITLELQVLRETNQKLVKEVAKGDAVRCKYNELHSRVRELEEQLAASHRRRERDIQSVSDSAQLFELQEKIAVLNVKYDDATRDVVQHNKENKRLKNSLQLAEERVKSALHDQMTLHNQIQGLEDELASSKASITKLSRELEDQKNSRGFKEEAEKRISDLQRHIQTLVIDVEEAKAGSSVVTKLQSDLFAAESLIQNLENKVDSYVVELEKGAVAIDQLDSLREQLRVKTKENRDMALLIHGLESQLRDVPYLHNRVTELTEELNDCKLKTDKIPGLLSEIARLRGSSRASVKALVEQDKSLATMKAKLKQTEADIMQLKKDNRTMQELESRLKEATAENRRLLSIAAEVSSLKVGIKQQEEEKKTIIDQNKKIKNMMRKASIVGTAFQPASSSSVVGGVPIVASAGVVGSSALGASSSNLNESLNTAMAQAQVQQQQLSYTNSTFSGTSDGTGGGVSHSQILSRNPTPERVF